MTTQSEYVASISEHFRRVREQVTDQVLSTLVINVKKFEENYEPEIYTLFDWCDGKLRLALTQRYVKKKIIVHSLAVISYMLGYVSQNYYLFNNEIYFMII